MTNDEIDAILMPELARHFLCEPGNLTATESEYLAFRAGMREAAQIAREREFARGPADAIERAASDEPPATIDHAFELGAGGNGNEGGV